MVARIACRGVGRFAAAVLALVALASAGAAPARQPAALQGVVTQVIDGDTLRFTPAGQPAIVVRLAQIDAPEICQPWGAEARRALFDLVLNKAGSLRSSGRDSYGRVVGVLVIDEVNIGQRLVEEGHAWSLRTRNDRGPLVKEERMAKALTRGLHAGGGAVKPADFRRAHGPCTEGAPARVTLPPAAPPPPQGNTVMPSASSYRCDSRKYCTQMTSCAEAKYFLAHCPGVKMDGDGDGIPCEDQWCRG